MPSTTALVAVVLLACSGATSPRPATELVALVGGEAPSIAIVDPSAGRVLVHVGPIQPFKEAATLTPDGKTLWIVGVGTAGRELIAVDTRALAIRSRLALSSPAMARALDGVYVWGTTIAPSPDGAQLVVGGVFFGSGNAPVDSEFLGILDSTAQHVLRTVGPLQAREGSGLATLPRSVGLASGGVVAIGSRVRQGFGVRAIDRIWTLAPPDMAIIDSATPEPEPPPDQDALLQQVLPSPDGRRIYVLSAAGMIYAYDVATHTFSEAVAAPTKGRLSIAPDGNSLYLTDPGDGFDTPGSGMIYVYGPNLVARAPIDLRPAFGGVAQSSSGAAVSADGRSLYVATGTAHLGPNYPPERLQLTVVDLTRLSVGKPIPVNDWGGATPVVLPP